MASSSCASESTLQRVLALECMVDFHGGTIEGVSCDQFIRELVKETKGSEKTDLQMLLVRIVVERLLNDGLDPMVATRTARDEQVQSIRRIVYGKGDTILLARTGFGKSIVFQSVFVLLPGSITILIVPLTRCQS
jgi:superfamily II DNA helicase RecQ